MISKVKPQNRRKSDSALQGQKKNQAFSTPQPPKGGKANKQKGAQQVAQKSQTPKQNVKKGTPKQQQKTPNKKRKLEEEQDDDDDEEEDEEIQFKATPKSGMFKGQLEEDDDDDEDDDDEDDDEEDEDEDEEEDEDEDDDDEEDEEVSQPPQKKQKAQPAAKKQKLDTAPSNTQKAKAASSTKDSKTGQTQAASVDGNRKMDLDSKTLYIKNLPQKSTVREIKALTPEVKQVRLRVNTNRFNKRKSFSGYAYLEYASEAVAEKNYKLLTGATLNGNALVVDYVGHKSAFIQARKDNSEPEDIDPLKLYIAGLPMDCTDADLRKLFPKASEIKIPFRQKDKKPFGYGFVTFTSEALAKESHDKCQNVTLKDMTLVVLFSKKRKEQPKKQEVAAKKKATDQKQKVAQPPAKKAKVEEEEDDEDEDEDDDEDNEDEDDSEEGAEQGGDDDDDDEDDDDDDDDDEDDDDDDDDDDDEDDD